MTNLAFIIKNNKVIAEVNTAIKSGEVVKFSYDTCEEAINADRERNLANVKFGKISRAKKWANKTFDYATEINPGEFLLESEGE